MILGGIIMVICSLLVLAVIIISIWSIYEEEDNIILGIVVAIALGSIVGVVSFGIAMDVSEVYLRDDFIVELDSKEEIVALKDNASVSGTRFLLSGSVNGTLYYHYAVETENGTAIKKVKAESCYLQQCDDTPCVEKYSAKGFTRWYLWIWGVPNRTYYVIKAPQGTLDTTFAVDLE